MAPQNWDTSQTQPPGTVGIFLSYFYSPLSVFITFYLLDVQILCVCFFRIATRVKPFYTRTLKTQNISAHRCKKSEFFWHHELCFQNNNGGHPCHPDVQSVICFTRTPMSPHTSVHITSGLPVYFPKHLFLHEWPWLLCCFRGGWLWIGSWQTCS